MTEVRCPSGLTGRVRGMKVREERILADRKLAKMGGQVDRLLAACWEKTLDPGPYDFGDKDIDWGKVLQGDRFYALLQLRAATYGPIYAFQVGCQNAECRAKIEWEVDVVEDLPVQLLEGENLERFRDGNVFETVLPDSGAVVRFRLLTGAEERKIPQLRKSAGDRVLSAMLALRIVEIEGVEARRKRAFIDDLTMADATFLMAEFDRVDCGVDTSIEIECPHCYTVQTVDLPFDRTFFVPGRKTTRPGRTSSSSPETSSSGEKTSSECAGRSTEEAA